MSDQDALTPRVFLVRHGETDWAQSGRFTGISDITLNPAGIAQIRATAGVFVGTRKLIDPSRLTKVFVSPRARAVKTLELLLPSFQGEMAKTEAIAEWNYGAYEGLKDNEIRELRKEKGLDRTEEWDIWSEGCEDGESPEEITDRLDRLIAETKGLQAPYMRGEQPADVLFVAHGLILRCFVKRWLGHSIGYPLQMILAPGGVVTLSYKKRDINKPAFHIGLPLPSQE